LSWAIVVNSCIGLLLYLALLSRGASGRVASLFYLVPPTTAVLAALILHAHFGVRDAAGFGLAAAGVWLGQRG
jgi:drug/metabolite transporter (DMT)-like permease